MRYLDVRLLGIECPGSQLESFGENQAVEETPQAAGKQVKVLLEDTLQLLLFCKLQQMKLEIQTPPVLSSFEILRKETFSVRSSTVSLTDGSMTGLGAGMARTALFLSPTYFYNEGTWYWRALTYLPEYLRNSSTQSISLGDLIWLQDFCPRHNLYYRKFYLIVINNPTNAFKITNNYFLCHWNCDLRISKPLKSSNRTSLPIKKLLLEYNCSDSTSS